MFVASYRLDGCLMYCPNSMLKSSWIRFEALERMTKSDALMMRVSKENRTEGVSLSCKRTARCSCQCHSHFCCFERERRNLFSFWATDQNFRRLPVPSLLRCYFFPTFGAITLPNITKHRKILFRNSISKLRKWYSFNFQCLLSSFGLHDSRLKPA